MRYKTFRYSLLFVAILFAASSCKKLLQEQPRTFFAPTFFTTSDGLQGGIAGIYSSFRGSGPRKFGRNFLIQAQMSP